LDDCMDGRMEGWKDGRMEGWKDGRVEGWKDGRVEGFEALNTESGRRPAPRRRAGQ